MGGADQFTTGTSGSGSIGGLLSGIGGQGAPVTWAANSILGIDTTSASQTYSGNITTAIGLNKLGGNALTLTGSNSYTGPTTISTGTLAYTGSGGNFGGGSYTLNTNANGALLINTSGTVAAIGVSWGGANAGTVMLQSGVLAVGSGGIARHTPLWHCAGFQRRYAPVLRAHEI